MLFDVRGVGLRDNQRHVGTHPKIRAVIDDHAPGFDRVRGIRDRGAFVAFGTREKGDIHPLERIFVERFNLITLTVDHNRARAAGKDL